MLSRQRARMLLSGTIKSCRVSIFLAIPIVVLLACICGCGGGSSPQSSTPVPTSNSQPMIANVSPSETLVGSGLQTLTINGSSFLSSSVVMLAGASQPVTFVNAGQLTIQVTAAEQATAGSYPVVVVNPAPGGGSSNSIDFTVNNPQPALASVSPGVLATGSPDTTVVLSGSGFVSGSTIHLSGSALTTQFVSATELRAVLPAAALGNAGSLALTATNSTPGGGDSAPVPLNVVTVSSFAILAIPATTASPANTWLVSAAAIDKQGLPIVGLPVTFSTNFGELNISEGQTSVSGGLSVQVAAPIGSNSPHATTVSATTGSQTAVAAMTVGGGATSTAIVARKRDFTFDGGASSSSANNLLASVGVSGPPGSTNQFLDQPNNCVTADALSTAPSSECTSSLSQNNLQVNASAFVNMACNSITAINNIGGVAQCAGFSVSVLSCALSETGVGAVLCGAALTTGFDVTLGLASGCLQYLAGLAAEQFHLNLLTTAIDEFGIVTDATNPLGYASLICDNLPPTTPPVQTNGPSTQLVCPFGSTCLVVVNFGADSVTVYDSSGNQLGTPAGAFSGLAGPDGIVFDPNNNYFYIANVSNDTIGVYDLYGNPVTTTQFTGLTVPGIEDVSFDPLRKFVLANSPSQNQISVFEEDGTPVSFPGGFADLNQPFGVGVNSQNGNLYVSNFGNNTMTVYDSSGKEITLPTGAFSNLTDPDDTTFDPATGNIYIAEAAEDSGQLCTFSGIAVFDQNGNAVATPGGFPNLSCPDQIVTNGNGVSLRLYVTNINGNSIRIYDGVGNDLTPVNVFPGLNQPTGIAIVQMAPATTQNARASRLK